MDVYRQIVLIVVLNINICWE